MALHWPTFFKRLGSAIIFSLIMMVGLLGQWWSFFVLVAAIQILCLREFFELLRRIFPDSVQPVWLTTMVQLCGLALLFGCGVFALSGSLSFLPLLLFLPSIILFLNVLSKRLLLPGFLQSCGGFFYVVLPLVLFLSLRNISIILPLSLVLLLWINDTMAYLVGSFFGKTPFSKISPKKTWEGTGGGAILTIAAAAVWGYYSPYYHFYDWMMLAVCVTVGGTAGDLLESKLKRIANVKDSGTLMPGHGGALDRFDSLLFAVPFAFCYAYFFMEPLPLSIF